MPSVQSSPAFIILTTLLVATPVAYAQSLYRLQTLAGGDYAGDGGAANSALLVHIEGLAADFRGNIYIADADDNRVRKVTPAGIISTFAGNGRAGFSGDGGPASTAQLRTPYGVAADRNGNIYIADLGNARVRRVSPDGVIQTVAGGGTTPAWQGDGQPATNLALTSPRNVAVDYYGTVYFSDFGGNRVFEISENGLAILIAGAGEPGFAGDGGAAPLALLSAPAGVAVDPAGVLYIADSGNARIRTVYRGVIHTLGDLGVAGAVPAVSVKLPTGLAMDPDGSLFIADIGGNQTLRVTPSLTITPIPQPARDIAIDAQGNLYACDGPVVYRRPRAGAASLFAGGTPANYSGDLGPLAQVRFNQPGSVVRNLNGDLFIADTAANRVRKITSDGNIYTVAGDGVAGYSGDGGPAAAAHLNNPLGLAVDTAGNLFIADTGNHAIRKVRANGIITTLAGNGTRGRSLDGAAAFGSQLDSPTWLALGPLGAVYFSESGTHRVRAITTAGALTTLAGTGVSGYSGDGGSATAAALNSPQGLVLDSAGAIYVADSGNRRIRRIGAPSALGPSTISTYPDKDAAVWRGARGLALDPQGVLFVADAADHRLFRIDPPGRITTIAGTGVPGFTAESGAALEQAVNAPSGLVADGLGNVYFADAGNNRVRILIPVADTITKPPPADPGITIVNAASLRTGAVAPGEIATIFGSGIGPATGVAASLPNASLGGTQVLFNGRLAPLFYASATQLNLQVPYSLGDGSTCEVQVLVNGLVKSRATVDVAAASPGIFTVAAGSGQVAALNEDGSVNSADRPAARGSVLVLFATGGGKTNPSWTEGVPAGVPLPAPVLPVSVRIGDYSADVLYAGAAPGFAGLMQVNARIPGGFLPPGVLPVSVQVGAYVSPAGPTIVVK